MALSLRSLLGGERHSLAKNVVNRTKYFQRSRNNNYELQALLPTKAGLRPVIMNVLQGYLSEVASFDAVLGSTMSLLVWKKRHKNVVRSGAWRSWFETKM
jgi:hypothetical protein